MSPAPMPQGLINALICLLAFIVGTWTLHAGAELLVPLTLATLLRFALSPAVSGLQRLRLPRAVAAGAVVLLLGGAVLTCGWLLAEPASVWLERLPDTIAQLEAESRSLQRQVEEAQELSLIHI